MSELNQADGGNKTIHVVNTTDSICTPCPHRQQSACASETKVQMLDSKHAAALQLTTGDTLTWNEAKERIKENITLDIFHKICDGCSWKSSRVCEQVITSFLGT